MSGTAHPEPSDSAQEDLLVEARREVLPRPADATTSPALLDSESAVKSVAAAGSDAAAATSQPVDDGIVYVDAAGRVTFANQAARTLLQWNGGELALGDVLAGGRVEAAALLEAVSRQELVERSVKLQIGSWRGSLEVSTLALRDRDGNLWGAALFLRRSGDQAAASSATPR